MPEPDTINRVTVVGTGAQIPLMDLTGIDIGCLAKTDRYAETGDRRDLPATSVAENLARGELRRKAGRGWYEYDDQQRGGGGRR